MIRTLVFSIASVGFLASGFAVPAAYAAVDPAASTDTVYDPCKQVSDNPEIADPQSGICVTAAGKFVAALAGTDPAAADQAIADAVTKIASLAAGRKGACGTFEDEIAAAVRMLATKSSSSDQASQLNEIAQTIADCQREKTASIFDEGSNLEQSSATP